MGACERVWLAVRDDDAVVDGVTLGLVACDGDCDRDRLAVALVDGDADALGVNEGVEEGLGVLDIV